MAVKRTYKELSNAQIEEARRLVISNYFINGEDSGFTLAQQVEVEEGKKKTRVFLKGGIHIQDIDCLYNLRDAVNNAINLYEENKDLGWDE